MAGERILEEGTLAVGIEFHRSGPAADGIHDELAMQFGPVCTLSGTFRVETVGGRHDVLRKPLVVAPGTLRLFFHWPIDTAVGFVDRAARSDLGRCRPFVIDKASIDGGGIIEQCLRWLDARKRTEDHPP